MKNIEVLLRIEGKLYRIDGADRSLEEENEEKLWIEELDSDLQPTENYQTLSYKELESVLKEAAANSMRSDLHKISFTAVRGFSC